MPTDKLPTPERVLVIAAHPDDIEFGAAGTIARWIGEGAEVHYVIVTRGDKGSDDPAADPGEIGRLREQFTRAIRRHRPEIVMTHDPSVLFVNNEWVNHPDHRAVGQSAVDAVFPTARDPLNFHEHLEAGLGAWKVGQLYLWSTNEANQLVDIAGTLDAKIAALRHHASQFRDFDGIERWVRRRAEELGERAGYRAAEGFRRVTLAR
jgi:LmbE family N-acetylglucosaminyl deacetylase